jgi:MFS superfamily sulfate permease-like transporter
LSGAIGGLPMIAEIVRSSANVTFGAKTWRANFFHGFIILLAVLVLPKALSLIPLSALAAILVMIGWRLGNPTHFRHAMKVGKDNLLGFTVTLVMTLAVDLLVGIFCGAIAQFAIEIYLGLKLKHSLKASYEIRTKPEITEIIVHSSLAFSNFTGLREAIMKNAQFRKIFILDLTMCDYIDHSVMEQIEEIKEHFKYMKTPLTVNISTQHYSLGKDLMSARKKI